MSFHQPNSCDHVHSTQAIHRADDDRALDHRQQNHHFSVPTDHMDVRRRMLSRRQQDAHAEPLGLQDGRHRGRINPTAGFRQSVIAARMPVGGLEDMTGLAPAFFVG